MSGFLELVRAGDHAGILAMLRADPALSHTVDENDRSALRIALSRNDEKTVRMLQDHGADPDPYECVLIGDLERLKWHIEAEPAVLERPDCTGQRLIHVAATSGRTGIARWLLKRGVEAAAKTEDDERTTALHLACRHGCVRIAQALLDAAPDLVSARDADGRYALHEAATSGHEETVALLVEQGADPTATDLYGDRPDEHALRSGVLEVAERLQALARARDREARARHVERFIAAKRA